MIRVLSRPPRHQQEIIEGFEDVVELGIDTAMSADNWTGEHLKDTRRRASLWQHGWRQC